MTLLCMFSISSVYAIDAEAIRARLHSRMKDTTEQNLSNSSEAGGIEADDLTTSFYSKAKQESLAQRLRKEKRIVIETVGEIPNQPNLNDDALKEMAQNVVASKIAAELAGVKFSSSSNSDEYSKEEISKTGNNFSSTTTTHNTYNRQTNKVNFHSVSFVPGSIVRTKDTFSAKFKFVLFYNKAIQILQFETDSFLFAMADTIINGLETELGSYKNDFFVMHYADNYKERPGYELRVTKAAGTFRQGGSGTNYEVRLEVTITNNNTGFENESRSFIATGKARKRVKGLLGGILQPVASGLTGGENVGTALTGNREYDFQNSNTILSMGRNSDGFREAANAAIKDVCAQIHVYVNQ